MSWKKGWTALSLWMTWKCKTASYSSQTKKNRRPSKMRTPCPRTEARGPEMAKRNEEINIRFQNATGQAALGKYLRNFQETSCFRSHDRLCRAHDYQGFESHRQSFGRRPQRNRHEAGVHAYRPGRELSFQNRQTGGWLSRRAHLASDPGSGGLCVWKNISKSVVNIASTWKSWIAKPLSYFLLLPLL